jgi:dual specificity protein kinase YAK1
MWSFGCIVAELFIGLPLFPGASEYDVLCRMIEILGGQPPDDLLREAKNTGRFFKHVGSIYPGSEARNGTGSAYRILSEDEIEARESKRPKVGRWYFPRGRLDRLIFTYPWKNLSEETLPGLFWNPFFQYRTMWPSLFICSFLKFGGSFSAIHCICVVWCFFVTMFLVHPMI